MLKNKLTPSILLGAMALGIFGSAPLMAAPIKDEHTIERLGFKSTHLQICHQKEWRDLTVELEYESTGIPPNTQEVKDHVRAFLEEYSKPMDYWEVMNTNLIRHLKTKFPNMQFIRSELALNNDKQFFSRSSIVTYNEQTNSMKETFSYVRPNYTICNQTFKALDLYIIFDVKENPTPQDYPDYQWVNSAMEEFFKEQPISTSTWYTLKPKLESYLLEKFPSLTCLSVDLKVHS